MIWVLVVEDSPTARALLVRILESDPTLKVVGLARNGLEAVALAGQLRPDVITMDIRMPGMDGFVATKRIMHQVPTPIVVVSNESDNLDTAFNATRAGALTVIAKPSGPGSPNHEATCRRLITTVKLMADVKVVRRWATGFLQAPEIPPQVPLQGGQKAVVAMAASTGGPAALYQILRALPTDFPLPILVVQHIAQGFGQGMVSWLSGATELSVKLAEQGGRLSAGQVLVAPDDRHLVIRSASRISLRPRTEREGVCPSADLLFESVAQAFGRRALGVILTGMGRDGVEGLKRLKEAGGTVLAQDEASSVVFGMPKEALAAGVVDQVVPLERMARKIIEMLQ